MAVNTQLTPIQQQVIGLIKENNGVIIGSANLGFLLWPNNGEHRRPQGMALAAGKVCRPLIDMGVITAKGQPAEYRLARTVQ